MKFKLMAARSCAIFGKMNSMPDLSFVILKHFWKILITYLFGGWIYAFQYVDIRDRSAINISRESDQYRILVMFRV